MLTFFVSAMEVPETALAVGLFILNTKPLRSRQLAVCTINFLSLPLATLSKYELGIILPLVLLGVLNKVFMRKHRQLLLAGTHIDSIKIRFSCEKVIYR